MKKLLLILLLLPAFGFSQKVLDVVALSDGKVIVVYDDKTWGYPDDVKKGSTTPQGISSAPSTPTKETTPVRNTTPTRTYSPSTSTSSQCTGTTQKGARCKRMVRGGGRCYQH